MLRTDLLSVLELIQPALAREPIVPIMACVCFTGSYITAFNDLISIQLPFKTDFTGAIPGETLIKVLSASIAKEVSIIVNDSDSGVIVKCGGTKLTLPLLPKKNFAFTIPEFTKKSYPKLSKEHTFFPALKDCLLSVGDDLLSPDQCGVTIIRDGEKFLLFSTNRTTITHAKIGGLETCMDWTGARVILPTQFCEQILKHASGKDMGLHIDPKGHAIFFSDDVMIWGRLLESDHPLDFVRTFQHLVGKMEGAIETPKRWGMIIDRMLIVADDKEAYMQIKIQDSKARCELASKHGELIETMTVEGHPDINTTLKPKFVKSAADFDKMLLTEKCLIMSKSKTVYLVSTKE